jgi:toxin ParE1/3/4
VSARFYLTGRVVFTAYIQYLSEDAAHPIEQLLDQSILDSGLPQTGACYHDLTHCLALLADDPKMGNSAEDIRPGYRCFPHASHVIF